MKDQYFGDFGDYQKISLLTKLLAEDIKVGTHWMKTQDDGSNDGKHISYLENPSKWEDFEPEIYRYLKSKVNRNPRTLKHIEDSHFCSAINFTSDYIENSVLREILLNEICDNKLLDLVFFDPDNGIEVATTSSKNIHKYVTWDELKRTFDSGKSVLVYQHFARVNRENFISIKMKEVSEKINPAVVSIQVKHSVYFFVLQKKHRTKIEKALKSFTDIWREFSIKRDNTS